MLTKNNSLKYLKLGDCFYEESETSIVSDLGTCIAICVYDKKLRRGGAIHFMLPKSEVHKKSLNPLEFGQESIPFLLKKFKNGESKKENLIAYLIGGCVSEDLKESTNISEQNRNFAIEQLQLYGIKIQNEKTLINAKGMRFKFNTLSGEIFTQKIENRIVPKVKNNSKIKVLVVDDSESIRKILVNELQKFEELEIVGVACDAFDAEKKRQKSQPDVMTLDLNMPGKDGLTYLKELMINYPMPVIIISDLSPSEAGPVLSALEFGAFDFVHKPKLSELKEKMQLLKNLICEAYKNKTKKIKKNDRYKKNDHGNILIEQTTNPTTNFQPHLIAIGASTGGTEALREVFSKLPSKTPPILVVQHMPPVFTAAFAESLKKISLINVVEAKQGQIVQHNCAYVAPGGRHMKVVRRKSDHQLEIIITDDEPVNRFKPSVDYLFESLVQLQLADKLTIALLTGMGSDGAQGLLQLRKTGSFTIAQDEESCVVFGMPKVAIEMGAVDKVASIYSISNLLLKRKKGVS